MVSTNDKLIAELSPFIHYDVETDSLIRTVSSGGKIKGTKINTISGIFALNGTKYSINKVKTIFSGVKIPRNTSRTKVSNPITQEELKKVISYDKMLGTFKWAEDRGNNAVLGCSAGMITAAGYLYIKIGGKQYMAHRLAWLYEYGTWPEFMIDHINRDKLDNRINNLRDVPRSLNALNSEIRSDNTSGYKGITKSGKSWSARISIDGVNTILGYFNTIEEALLARVSKEKELGLEGLC